MSPIIRMVRDRIRYADIDTAVNLLLNGELIIAPTDTVYGVFGMAFNESVANSLDKLKTNRKDPYAVLFSDINQVEDTIGEIDLRRRRIVKALLPGPFTLILPLYKSQSLLSKFHSNNIGIRISGDSLIPELCRRINSPLWGSSANRSGSNAPIDFISIDKGLFEEVAIAIDAGPTIYRQASTVIDLTTQPFYIKRAGPLLSRVEKVIEKSLKPIKVLIVCSGNICRSPLAASLLQSILGNPEISGIEVSSAGLEAIPGESVSEPMMKISAEWGINLQNHKSKLITSDMVAEADLILVMTEVHKEWTIRLFPESAGKIRLLGEKIDINSIPDPYMQNDSAYQLCADLIKQAVKSWGEWLKYASLN